MEVTLLVNGRVMTFSKEELTSIVEAHFSNQTEEQKFEVNQKPTEGKWVKVNPKEIDQKLFAERRVYETQEKLRNFILSAFDMLKKYPKLYERQFEIMIPAKIMSNRTSVELEKYAKLVGDSMAHWVHQALEWAQRIANGATWESICYEFDTAKCCRLVNWKDDRYLRIGGCSLWHTEWPEFRLEVYSGDDKYGIDYTVPLIVRYKE